MENKNRIVEKPKRYDGIDLTLLLILSFALGIVCTNLVYEYNNEITSNPYIGISIPLQQDTLVITDYSPIFQEYTLNDGVKIDAELIEMLVPLEK